MIDRLRQLAIFAKTIDHGSFRGAARDLRLSPSVVSHHISQLEEHLGIALLYRSTRKLKLTPDGERLLAATRNMLDAIEGELLELAVSGSEPSGELRLTAPSVLSKSHFTDMIAKFLSAHPRVRLSVDFSDERRNIIDDGLDIAIRMAVKSKRPANSRLLFRVKRKLIASPAYIEARAPPKEPLDLRQWDWLELSPVRNLPAKFYKSDTEQIVHRKPPQCSCNDAQGVYRLARAGAGVALVPEFLATDDLDNGTIQFVLPEWEPDSLEVFAVRPSNAPKHGLIDLLINELTDGS